MSANIENIFEQTKKLIERIKKMRSVAGDTEKQGKNKEGTTKNTREKQKQRRRHARKY